MRARFAAAVGRWLCGQLPDWFLDGPGAQAHVEKVIRELACPVCGHPMRDCRALTIDDCLFNEEG